MYVCMYNLSEPMDGICCTCTCSFLLRTSLSQSTGVGSIIIIGFLLSLIGVSALFVRSCVCCLLNARWLCSGADWWACAVAFIGLVRMDGWMGKKGSRRSILDYHEWGLYNVTLYERELYTRFSVCCAPWPVLWGFLLESARG